jgi:RNA polymerase sigma-70 factor (ECF subfamily)
MAAGPSASDLELAAALAHGREEALAQLYDRYGGLVYSVALRILGDPARAEDAVQESFFNVWNNAGRFDANRGSLRAWLVTTARNRSIDYMRGRAGRERREQGLDVESAGAETASDPWREMSRSMERTAVREAVASLPPEQRKAIELAYFDGYTCREIAELTQAPLGTVKGRLRLGLEKMASYLQGRGLLDV